MRHLPSRSSFLVVALALVVLVAACGDDGSTRGDDDVEATLTTTVADSDTTSSPDDGDVDTTTPPDDGDTAAPPSDDVLFTITYEGGFASPSMLASIGPAYAMTTDGRLVLSGPVLAIYPGPLVPNYQVVDASELLPDIREILDRIGIADITEEIDDSAQAMDASTTVLTYFDENGAHRFGVSALGFDPAAEQDPRSVALSDLLLTLESANLIDDGWSEFESDRWQVVLNGDFLPDAEPVDGLEYEVRPYPLDIAVADFEHTSFGLPCTILEGDAAAAAAEEFIAANQLTVWDTGDEQIQLLARPLLPGEEGCPEG